MKSEMNAVFAAIGTAGIVLGAIYLTRPQEPKLPPAIESSLGELSDISAEMPERFFGPETEVFQTILPILEKNFFKIGEDERPRLKGITYTKGMVFLCFLGSEPDKLIEPDGTVRELGPPSDEYHAVTSLYDLREALKREANKKK